ADNVANSGSQSGSVTVDNTAPAPTNAMGATSGTTRAGDVEHTGSNGVGGNASGGGSGVTAGSLSADLSAITSGSSAVAMSTSGGPCTIDGTSYAYRTAQQTAKNPLAAGSVTYSVTGADNLANSTSPSSSVTVDNTAPASSNTTLANGGTTGTADAGDTVTIVYSEKIASSTFCSTWTDN